MTILAKFDQDSFDTFRGENFSNFIPPFFLFLAWRPCWITDQVIGHNSERGQPKDHFSKVW